MPANMELHTPLPMDQLDFDAIAGGPPPPPYQLFPNPPKKDNDHVYNAFSPGVFDGIDESLFS
jgi:hypothetical protein